MQRAGTEKELKERLKSLTTVESREAYTKYHKQSQKIVDNEVELALHTNKIHLKFEEEPISRIGDDRKIRGVYFACVELPNGSIRIHKVATNWVEANFSAESLSVVQSVAKETKQIRQEIPKFRSHMRM